MNTTTAVVPTVGVPAVVEAGGPYSWPRNDVGFSVQARTLRSDARAARRARRAPAKAEKAARRAQFWRSPEGVAQFAAHMGMPVWGAVLTAMTFGGLIGTVIGMAVHVVRSV